MPNYPLPNHTADTASEYKNNIDAAAAKQDLLAGQFYAHEADTPDMTMVVDAGRMLSGGVLVVQAQQTTAAIVAPVTDPRIDRVVIDENTGAVSVVAGVEAASPVASALPVGVMPCCQVALAVGMSVITNDLITDERVSLQKPAHRGALVWLDGVGEFVPNSNWEPINFTLEAYDTDAIHDNVTTTARLTVPAGVSKIKLSAQIGWVLTTAGTERVARITKNGLAADYAGRAVGGVGADRELAWASQASLQSPVLEVVPGDYFIVEVRQDSGSGLNIQDAWFSMEIIE